MPSKQALAAAKQICRRREMITESGMADIIDRLFADSDKEAENTSPQNVERAHRSGDASLEMGDREIDALVAERVMGLTLAGHARCDRDPDCGELEIARDKRLRDCLAPFA